MNHDIFVNIYVGLIIKKRYKFSNTPATVKEKVRQNLIDLGFEELIQE